MDYDFIKQCYVSNHMLEELGKFTLLWSEFELLYFENDCSTQNLRNLNNHIQLFDVLVNMCHNM